MRARRDDLLWGSLDLSSSRFFHCSAGCVCCIFGILLNSSLVVHLCYDFGLRGRISAERKVRRGLTRLNRTGHQQRSKRHVHRHLHQLRWICLTKIASALPAVDVRNTPFASVPASCLRRQIRAKALVLLSQKVGGATRKRISYLARFTSA
jgi:hypothetical protein